MFAKCDKHHPSRSGQTSLATAVTKFTKPVTKNYFGPSTIVTATSECMETARAWNPLEGSEGLVGRERDGIRNVAFLGQSSKETDFLSVEPQSHLSKVLFT